MSTLQRRNFTQPLVSLNFSFEHNKKILQKQKKNNPENRIQFIAALRLSISTRRQITYDKQIFSSLCLRQYRLMILDVFY